MKCNRVSMASLLLIAIIIGIVKGRDWKVPDMMKFGVNTVHNLINQNNFYQFIAPVDKYDSGTADDRDRSLDDKVAQQEEFKTFYEAFLEKINFFSLPPQQQANLQSMFESDPAIQVMTSMCREVTKRPLACDEKTPYRTFDGTCNNLEHPTWGSVLECTTRALPPHYKNVKEFRESVTGKPLPQPRKLSRKIHTNIDNPNDMVCHMITFFGQLIDHDITKTAASSANGIDLQCCAATDKLHPQCAPLMLKKDDPFYKDFNKTCINFVRSAPCSDCAFRQRTQMNTVTAFIDCSPIYGTTKQKADELRAMDGSGKLKSMQSEQGELLPPDRMRGGDCGDTSKGEYCFNAGDPRVNVHTPLMTLQTVFLRYHNFLCDGLKDLNPHWDDEKIYQEAKKIVIAVFQHITYDEWLVWIIGKKFMDRDSLWANEGTERIKYNPKVNPTVETEFNSACFRLHSIIGAVVSDFIEDEEKKWLRDEYSDAQPIYRNGIDELLTGIIKTESQKQDRFMVHDVTDYLYRKKNAPYGLDLAAINIHRGRDHGLAPYIKFVKLCSGKEIKSFDDLTELMSERNVKLLKSSYRHVADIDAWVGIQLEKRSDGGIVGKTAGCVITKGFFTWKFGDRFYYENPGVFTDDQLLEIKKMILSAVFCQTTQIEEIHKFAFLCPVDENPVVSCSDMPQIDLSKWKEDIQS